MSMEPGSTLLNSDVSGKEAFLPMNGNAANFHSQTTPPTDAPCRPTSGIPRFTALSSIPRLQMLSQHVSEPTSSPVNEMSNNNAQATHPDNLTNNQGPFENGTRSVAAQPPRTSAPRRPPFSPSSDVSEPFSKPIYRSRISTRSVNRYERAPSEDLLRGRDNESDTSSVFSSSGAPKVITSKIGSMKNVHHRPGGGNVRIFEEKVNFDTVHGKCNSLANVKYKPGGGDVQIVDEKLLFSEKSQSKVGSFKNVNHVPAGGDKQIISEKLDFTEKAAPKVASLANVKHKAGGGDVQILSEKLEFRKSAKSRVGSLQNADHQPGGGNVQIVDQKLTFSDKAHSKVASLQYAKHRAGGGDVQIFNEKLPWLKYNKPNLSPEEKARINKQRSGSHSDMASSMTSASTGGH